MHSGFIAVAAPWERTVASLSRLVGELVADGEAGDPSSLGREPSDDGFLIAGSEWQGRSYLLDTSMMISCGDFDRLVALSAELGCIVVAILGETVSGTYSLLVADEGSLVRLYYNCHATMSEPFSLGTPLATESVHPLEDIDGGGLIAALDSFGFRFEDWRDQWPKHRLVYPISAMKRESPALVGPLTQQVRAHDEEFAIPQNLVPTPRVVSRRMPDGSVGYDILPQQPSAPSGLFARWRAWLRSDGRR
jgi:hypothetical protein